MLIESLVLSIPLFEEGHCILYHVVGVAAEDSEEEQLKMRKMLTDNMYTFHHKLTSLYAIQAYRRNGTSSTFEDCCTLPMLQMPSPSSWAKDLQ